MVNDRCWTSLLGPGHVGTGLIWAVVVKKIVFPKLNIYIRYSKACAPIARSMRPARRAADRPPPLLHTAGRALAADADRVHEVGFGRTCTTVDATS